MRYYYPIETEEQKHYWQPQQRTERSSPPSSRRAELQRA
ncbi:hypothetical protein [Klebsiella phage vB_KpnS-VAC70]|uniref:Uncharacterized protein n=1 Tax=Klebsiella phage vB_KpnS-VAC70 TaxID=2866699 RepID=A0A8K1YYT1_9CAUD|nr:hypothetical protein [Klebsiella phage vB_KpnS-VAC70]